MARPGRGSVAEDPLDGFSCELVDLTGDLGDKGAGVVAGSVSFKPDLPAGGLTREDHLAAAEGQPQVTWSVNAHGIVTAGCEDVREEIPGDGRPAARVGGGPYQVLGHATIIPPGQQGCRTPAAQRRQLAG